jgi:sulfur relay (sulfurtransferase) complex TusBCD TusD component (DsrE family)
MMYSDVTGWMGASTLILTTAPYGDEKIWNALRLAKALVVGTEKMKVNIFLIGDAVTAAKKGQKPPEGFYNLGQMLKELIDQAHQWWLAEPASTPEASPKKN